MFVNVLGCRCVHMCVLMSRTWTCQRVHASVCACVSVREVWHREPTPLLAFMPHCLILVEVGFTSSFPGPVGSSHVAWGEKGRREEVEKEGGLASTRPCVMGTKKPEVLVSSLWRSLICFFVHTLCESTVGGM